MTHQCDDNLTGSRLTTQKITRLAPPRHGEFRASCPETLTRRETEVLTLLAYRLTNAEIAMHLNISVRTVECHVDRVLTKLQAANRREAASIAVRLVTGDGCEGTNGEEALGSSTLFP